MTAVIRIYLWVLLHMIHAKKFPKNLHIESKEWERKSDRESERDLVWTRRKKNHWEMKNHSQNSLLSPTKNTTFGLRKPNTIFFILRKLKNGRVHTWHTKKTTTTTTTITAKVVIESVIIEQCFHIWIFDDVFFFLSFFLFFALSFSRTLS